MPTARKICYSNNFSRPRLEARHMRKPDALSNTGKPMYGAQHSRSNSCCKEPVIGACSSCHPFPRNGTRDKGWVARVDTNRGPMGWILLAVCQTTSQDYSCPHHRSVFPGRIVKLSIILDASVGSNFSIFLPLRTMRTEVLGTILVAFVRILGVSCF